MTDLSITADDLIAMQPCNDWPESRIREIAGNRRWTTLEILALEQVPAGNRLWVVLRPALVPDQLLHELACCFAEEVLPIWERQYPEDKRPHEAIAAKRAWMRGEITDGQLAAVRATAADAAWSAVGAAAWNAAGAAAWAAAGAAARSAACNAAGAAVGAAAWFASEAMATGTVGERQVTIVREWLESEVDDG